MTVCGEDGCRRAAVARGLCNPCYQRAYRDGRIDGLREADAAIRERRRERLAADRSAGMTLREIAAKHGISYERVRQILVEYRASMAPCARHPAADD